VAVLSVSRRGRGPVAVPIWYEYRDGRFSMITFSGSLHGKIMQSVGRATITAHSETYGDTKTCERYAMAEGPIAFTDEDIEPLVRRLRRRYYTGARGDEWVNRPLDELTVRQGVAVLEPQTLSGYEWTEAL
jgi:nitroimidazol reductase NimA-like FMN-containing flavoprotein (pyridoxamine 5'-phosphate oxidase superfamily)